MYYEDFYCLFNHPEKDKESVLKAVTGVPLLQLLFH